MGGKVGATPGGEVLWDCGVRLVSRWIFNCYVIGDAGAGRPLVVDAGLPMNAHGAVAALAAMGRTPDELAGVAATHGHGDHVAGMPTLKQAHGTPVLLPAKVADYLDGERPRHPGLRQLLKITRIFGDQPFDLPALRELAAASKVAGFGPGPFQLPVEPDGFLADGERVPGAPAWEVIATPGHTDDSISFYNAETATLLSGDAVLTHGDRAWFNPELVDVDRSRATETRLRDLDVEFLLPGHGRPLRGRHLLRAARPARRR